jgi:hypothetical protein
MFFGRRASSHGCLRLLDAAVNLLNAPLCSKGRRSNWISTRIPFSIGSKPCASDWVRLKATGYPRICALSRSRFANASPRG